MKKAFEANVSRSKPRVRLSSMFTQEQEVTEAPSVSEASVEAIAAAVAAEPMAGSLADTIKARVQESNKPKAPVAVALRQAIEAPSTVAYASPVAAAEAPSTVVEVQSPLPAPETHSDAREGHESGPRRERLKERLRAVRDNPRPEPLPETVAEAGVLAVERISGLQTELVKVRALNLALTQDLESSRRQAERATEEARLRMDEARRIAAEMEGRVKLLSDLEGELQALESERDESLLNLQETRAALDQAEVDKQSLRDEITKRETALQESLSEEERLAGELEAAHDSAASVRRAADALRNERDTLARQVADLTKERAELLEARRALEAVHRALAHAVSR